MICDSSNGMVSSFWLCLFCRLLVFPSYLEYYRDSVNPMRGKMWDHELTIENGYVLAPDRPGLGLVPKWESLKAYKVG